MLRNVFEDVEGAVLQQALADDGKHDGKGWPHDGGAVAGCVKLLRGDKVGG